LADPSQRVTTRVLAGCALFCAAALAIGVVLQHVFDMQPCSWCVLQRLVFLAIGVACAIGAAVRARGPRLVVILGADALSAAGLAAALYQQFVASQSASCATSFADRVVMSLSLHELAPWMFMPNAPCNEANVPLLGVPFAIWSAMAFMLLGTAIAVALLATLRPRTMPG